MRSRSTSATTSWMMRARTMASSEANGSSISKQLRLERQHLRERHALALAAAQVPRKPVLESGKPEPRQPGVGLLERGLPLHAVEAQAERHVVARRAPRQQRVVLEQDAKLGRRDLGLDRAGERLLQSDHGAQQARLAGARRPDQADELAFANL